MDYVLFGIQGSGKGTQGKILAERFSAAYFETGGELRRLSSENSELGKKVKNIIDAGHLVPNEVVMEIVENFSHAHAGQTVIWDGIPRNREQNISFEALLQKMGRQYTGMHFELSRQEAENRLLKRRICVGCKTPYPMFFKGDKCTACGGSLQTRVDDNPESIRTRLDIFEKETLPIIKEWNSKNKMISINASLPIKEVTREMLTKI